MFMPQENRELRTAVAIYRGTSLQALGASAALGGAAPNAVNGLAALGTSLPPPAGSNGGF